MNPAIKTHPNFDANDYAYLRAKGWTDQEIVTRWSEEAHAGNGPCRWEGEVARAKLEALTAPL